VARFATTIGLAVPMLMLAPTAFAQESPLKALTERKETIAAELATQAAFCSSRRDTDHFAFKGCIDWHSAVHGVWALIAFERATGDRRHAPLVASILDKGAVVREREYLRRRPSFELPYGRAWFLRLAIDHHALTSSVELRDMADDVAASLRDYFRSGGIDGTSGSYDSASWALINLFDYARHRGDGELQAEVAGLIRKQIVAPDPRCPLSLEQGNFMAICTNWGALAARVLEQDEYNKWLARFIEVNGLPSPISPRGAHSFGLNFSRAWGLWDMYAKSQRADVAEAYVRHFERGFSPASNWSGDYRAVGHWVAQFGMFALQPLFGPQAGR
jgi:hypothetical protein